MKQSTLGAYIRALRVQQKMTQAQLADKVGVTDKAVSKWERDISFPDMALFPQLADILGVTVNDLLTECVEEEQPSRLLQIFEMSHDIRTPLHIILGSVRLAEINRKDEELLQHYLESIRISGEYLLQSIDRLMKITWRDRAEIADKRYPSNVQELGEYLSRQPEQPKNSVPEYDFSGRRILVAEDIPMNREIVAEILKHTGAKMEFAEDGKICVDMMKHAPAGYYDMILMDIMMPEMDGMEATKRIRKLVDPEKASVPIIALSANVYEKDRNMALEAGMNAFAEKPIFINQLLETMRAFLNNNR